MTRSRKRPEPEPEKKPEPQGEGKREQMTQQRLASLAHGRLGPQIRKKVTEQDVHDAVRRIEFADLTPSRKTPRLLVTRLRFSGVVRLSGREPRPFNYDQAFLPGVNVVLVRKNGAGKSSILKTIKFGLTGDDGEYDDGVRSWIEDIWLHFSLDGQPYTTLLARRDGVWQGLLADKEECRPIEEAVQDVVWRSNHLVGTKAIQAALGKFFFQHYSLASLGWTRKGESQVSECEASWKTVKRRLLFPVTGD